MTTRYAPTDWQAGVSALSSSSLNKIEQGIKRAQPVGWIEVGLWHSPNPPLGSLFCDGSQVAKATYAELWDFVQENSATALGVGPGYYKDIDVDTFELPDLTGGVFGRGSTPSQAGQSGGAATHTHTNPNTATAGSHAHTQGNTGTGGDHVHTNPNTGAAGNHAHTQGGTSAVGGHTHAGPSHSHSFSDSFTTGIPSSAITRADGAFSTGSPGHTHSGSVSGTTGSASGTTGSGGDHSHTNPNTDTAGDHSHAVGATSSGGSHAHSNPDTSTGGDHAHTQGSTGSTSNLPPFVNFVAIVWT